MHPGQGQGLSLRDLGQIGGAETVTLLVSEMPLHTHAAQNAITLSNVNAPSSEVVLGRSNGGSAYQSNIANFAQMAPQALAPAGGSLPHNNMQPYLTLNFCIALQGVFPPRP
jgi:microcystin-dependent protein